MSDAEFRKLEFKNISIKDVAEKVIDIQFEALDMRYTMRVVNKIPKQVRHLAGNSKASCQLCGTSHFYGICYALNDYSKYVLEHLMNHPTVRLRELFKKNQGE